MAEPTVDIDIRIDSPAWRNAGGDCRTLVRRAARAALADAIGAFGISILLTGDDAIAELNRRWRDRDGATNVLSFPAEDDGFAAEDRPCFLGDIAIAYETLDREARRDGIPFADHLAHLVVHGVLHLRGYDHETDTDAEEMEARETMILASLGISDPYRATAELEQED